MRWGIFPRKLLSQPSLLILRTASNTSPRRKQNATKFSPPSTKRLQKHICKCTMELLTKIVADKNVELWVAQDDETIVGMATLAVVVIPEGERAQIEDVVVDGKYRGQGLGKQLSEKLIARARERRSEEH